MIEDALERRIRQVNLGQRGELIVEITTASCGRGAAAAIAAAARLLLLLLVVKDPRTRAAVRLHLGKLVVIKVDDLAQISLDLVTVQELVHHHVRDVRLARIQKVLICLVVLERTAVATLAAALAAARATTPATSAAARYDSSSATVAEVDQLDLLRRSVCALALLLLLLRPSARVVCGHHGCSSHCTAALRSRGRTRLCRRARESHPFEPLILIQRRLPTVTQDAHRAVGRFPHAH